MLGVEAATQGVSMNMFGIASVIRVLAYVSADRLTANGCEGPFSAGRCSAGDRMIFTGKQPVR